MITRIKHRKTEELNQEAIKILRSNELLQYYSQLRKGVRLFLNKSIRICQTGEAFSMHDFPEVKKNMWKKYIFALRKLGFIETIGKSAYASYRVKGFRLNDYWEKVAKKTTGVSVSNNSTKYENYPDLIHLLSDVDIPALHNIRLHFVHDSLYYHVKQYFDAKKPWNIQYNDSNKFLTIHSPIKWGEDLDMKIILTRTKLVQIIIQNTYKPIAYTESGIYSLIMKMGEIREYLNTFSNDIPEPMKWKFVRADFGIDCKKSINKMFPEMEFKDITGALVRLYAKAWPDGDRRLRLETIISPKKDLQMILKEVAAEQNRFVNVNYPLMF